ncbi:hypothetical protein [Flavobacterium microcysteis]|uniref:Lipoprotein n=1 Tax=Flavobacterium microcysteis TaxID=2596891 RepID=A0A501Q2F9_9FLAO|nr:hypothetical protein [Flavobacterium microcysteis]TPD67060.1 hypothetical protein FJA49_12320 [Flavobacterium microcysteis]
MKKILLLIAVVFFSSCLKKEQKEIFSTIVINLSHSQYPKQITIDSQKSQIEYKNLNEVLAASADANKGLSDSKIVSLDEASLKEILNLFEAIDTTSQKRNKSEKGMYSSIEAHAKDGKILNIDQLNDRHADEVVFMEAVLKSIAVASKDTEVQKETKILVRAL